MKNYPEKKRRLDEFDASVNGDKKNKDEKGHRRSKTAVGSKSNPQVQEKGLGGGNCGGETVGGGEGGWIGGRVNGCVRREEKVKTGEGPHTKPGVGES